MKTIAKLLRTAAFRLSFIYFLVFAAAAGLIVRAILDTTTALLREEVVASLGLEVRVLRDRFEAGGIQLLTEAVAERSRPGSPALYLLAAADGAVLAGNLARVPAELVARPQGGAFRYARPGAPGEAARLAAGVPIAIPGGAVLIVARDIDEQRVASGRVFWAFLAGLGALGAIGLAGGLVIAQTISRRIEAVTTTSRTIMTGDLTQRVPLAGTGDELDGLAQSLNAMLERIEHLMAGLKEVSDNIAHDLKTPLTRLRNSAEAALRDPAGATAWRGGLERTIEEADELIKTFNALLSIARLEAGAVRERGEPVDLAQAVASVAELYEPVVEEAGLTLDCRADGPLPARVNRQLVGQAIANLIDNAIKYGRPEDQVVPAGGAAITVTAERRGSFARVTVADRGPGIPAADRERVLKRFVRLEASRSRPGTGLGLSLVAAVARLHEGTLRLEDNGPGLRAVLELPLAEGTDKGAD